MSSPVGPIFRTRRRILGIPVAIRSDARDLIHIADVAFAGWPRTRARPAVRLRFDIIRNRPAGTEPFRYIVPTRKRLLIRGGGAEIRVDAARGRAHGRIGEGLLADPDQVRYGIIEATTLFLLTLRDRIPFHAAAIARGDDAILLAGPSGAGKSTLAWAAVRADSGWRLLSEDCVYLQTRGKPRVWGWPGFLHVAADAIRFFPELEGRPAVILPNGKLKMVVRVPASGPAARPRASRATLCLLDRTATGPRLERLDRAAALESVTAVLEPGFDRFAGAVRPALAAATDDAIWRLDVGPDPRRAVECLDRVVRRLTSTG